MKHNSLFLFYSLLIFVKLSAQVVNFPIQNFSLKEYGKNYSSQNVCVVQDKSGFMYFGNGNGVLQYDGRLWQFIPVRTGAYVSSVALDSSGTIFVGSGSEFGYLKSNFYGKLNYYSLSSKLKDSDKEFGAIIKIYAINNEVIFQSQEKLFILKKDSSINVINPTTSFHTSFVVNNELYVRERKSGLLKLSSNLLKPVEGGDLFADLGVFSMLPYNAKGDILIATTEKGLWKYSPNARNKKDIFIPLKTSNDTLMLSSGLYGGITLSDGSYAFNTLKMGTIILNKDLQISSVINKEMGIRVNDVKQIFEDSQQNLWMALNNGISMVSYQSNLSYYSEESGLIGSAHVINKMGINFFVGTSAGLFYRTNNSRSNDKYVKVNGINNQIWSLVKKQETLVAAGSDGIFVITNLVPKKVFDVKCRALQYDSINHFWLVGAEPGLLILNENWQLVKNITEISTDIISIELSYTDKNTTNVWAGTFQQGVFHVNIDKALNTTVNWIGLPKNCFNECAFPLKLNNKVVFGTKNGVYSYSENEGYQLNSLIGGFEFNKGVSVLFQQQQNMWASIYNKVVLFNTTNNMVNQTPFLSVDKGQLHCFYQEDTIFWIGSDDGLIRYDINGKKDYLSVFQTQIRKIKCGKDSIIYYGNAPLQKNDNQSIVHLNYKFNSIYFEYSSLFFEDNATILYSFKLEGQDTTWSNWTNETKAVFTNLHEGEYTFKVKSQNIYGVVSNEAMYSFIISAPWYRTWWAYTSYFLMSVFFIYGFIKNRTNKLIKEKEQLEKIVIERTAEVVKQKHLVEEKHKEITDSINYAERIQRSFLATKELLDENLKDYFVFFKPKDVVSGDFYWATTLIDLNGNKNFALVTADSTGHGVPGAIMSLLNITSLEKAIEHYTEPAEIFNATRKTIIERLKKDGSAEGGKDGMDATITVYDFKNKKIVITAANNPVWIVRTRDGNKEVIEIKADKMPLGKHDKQDVSFTQQEIELQSGDVVYSLTDGFPDQFGGEKGKKFMNKNLRELLSENAHLPMQKQKELLEITFTNWMGNIEQIDDVTLIGIRV